MATNAENQNQNQNQNQNNDQNQPQSGPVSGSAANTRGENVPSWEGDSGGAKHGKLNPENESPQGSNANLTTTTRGADSTDKEFRNNQPNASTLKAHKGNAGEDISKK